MTSLSIQVNVGLKAEEQDYPSSFIEEMSSSKDENPHHLSPDASANGGDLGGILGFRAVAGDDGIGEPTCNDVLLGRGVTINRHVGNVVSMHYFLIPRSWRVCLESVEC